MMKYKPDGITFLANIEEDSRIKFYNVLCLKANEIYNLKLSKFIIKVKETNEMAYCLYSNEKNKEIIVNTFKTLIPKLKKYD